MNQLQNTQSDEGLTQTNSQQITNITLMDNRETLEETTRLDPVAGANSSIHKMDEDLWSLLKLCARPQMVSQFQWKQNTDGPLEKKILPLELSQTAAYWYQLFSVFSFAKFDMNIRVQINTTRFHSGRLALVWNPMSSYLPPQLGLPATVWHSTSLPHAILDASMSNSADLVIPFQHYYSYLPLMGDKNTITAALGTFTVENLTGLNSVSPAVGTATGTIWFWFSNIELYVPVASHKPFKAIEAQSGVLEQKLILAEEIGDGAAKLVRSGTNVIRKGAQFLGVGDSPSDPNPSKHTLLSNGPMSHGRGVSNAVRLALDPISGVLTQPIDVATTNDEMNLSNIINRSALLAIIPITETEISTQIDLNPMAVLNIETSIYPTFLAYITRKFAFWRGSLKYRIEFVCSNFHTGRFSFSFVPNTTSISGSREQVTVNPSAILDLQEKRTFEFIIPYVSQQPYKTVSNFKTLTEPIDQASSIGTLQIRTLNNISYAGNVSPFCEMWIYVSAGEDFELAVPNNYKDKETRLKYLGDNDLFEPTAQSGKEQCCMCNETDTLVHCHQCGLAHCLSHIRYRKCGRYSCRTCIRGRCCSYCGAEAQSAYLSVENNSEQEPVPIIGNIRTFNSQKTLFGEDFMQLSNYLARNSAAFAFYINWQQFGFKIPIGTDLKLLTAQASNTPLRDNITWFSQLFVFWRGSMRVSSLSSFPRTIDGLQLVVTEPLEITNNEVIPTKYVGNQFFDNNVMNSLSGNAFHFANTTMTPNMEVELPYYTQYQNMLNRQPIEEARFAYPDSVHAVSAGTARLLYSLSEKQELYQRGFITRSAGPDFSFSYIGRPPVLSR